LTIPCLADTPPVPGHDDHAGKLILRDGQSPPAGQTAAPQQPTLDLDSGRVSLALIAVITLIFLLRWGGKSLFPAAIAAGRGQTVKVLARCPLAPRQQVLLIQVGRRIVVAADCNSQLNSLCSITDADEVASLIGEIRRDKSSPISTPFTSWFKRADTAYEADETDLNETERAEADSALPQPDNADLSAAAESPAPSAPRELLGLTQRVRDLTRALGARDRLA
jgi:flagellar biogenesis protein FliO